MDAHWALYGCHRNDFCKGFKGMGLNSSSLTAIAVLYGAWRWATGYSFAGIIAGCFVSPVGAKSAFPVEAGVQDTMAGIVVTAVNSRLSFTDNLVRESQALTTAPSQLVTVAATASITGSEILPEVPKPRGDLHNRLTQRNITEAKICYRGACWRVPHAA